MGSVRTEGMPTLLGGEHPMMMRCQDCGKIEVEDTGLCPRCGGTMIDTMEHWIQTGKLMPER